MFENLLLSRICCSTALLSSLFFPSRVNDPLLMACRSSSYVSASVVESPVSTCARRLSKNRHRQAQLCNLWPVIFGHTWGRVSENKLGFSLSLVIVYSLINNHFFFPQHPAFPYLSFLFHACSYSYFSATLSRDFLTL